MKTTNENASADINGSYRTPDGKAQIDFGITYRNGYPEFRAVGYHDGGIGQCVDVIAEAYRGNYEVGVIDQWHAHFHLREVSPETVNAVSNLAAMYPFRSFYESQAETFLSRNGLKFRATLSDTKAPAWGEDGKHGHHYRVTLSKEGGTRLYTGQCGHTWTAKPVLSASTYNLSGEPTQSCPCCGKRQMFADSIRESSRLTFDFWGSIADAEKGIQAVTPYSVLAGISGEAGCPETFADFCDEFGYERDSIKALQTFRRCSAFSKRLRAFFTAQELDELSEIQ